MAVQARADQGQTALSKKNAQRSRQVCIVLVASLFVFVAFCATAAFGLSAYLSSITNTETATIKAVSPSVLAVLRHLTKSTEYITGTTTLQEGDAVTTQNSDQAFISLFGDSGTITMYFNSNIEMARLRASRFFQNAKEVSVILHGGTISFATGGQGDYSSATYTLSTEQADVEIAPGSNLRVQVDTQAGALVTEVVVNSGSATMRSHGKRIDLGPQQMAWVSGNDLPQGPAEAQKDLISNGKFDEPPNSNVEETGEGGLGTAAWLPLHDATGVATSPGTVEITSEVNLKAAVLTGGGSPSRFVKVGITQDINAPASFFSTIELSATIKLVNQLSPAGGPAYDIYPLTVRIVYTDQFGKNHEWKRSFYFEGPDPDLADNSAIKITQGRWTTTQEMKEQRAHLVETSNLTGPLRQGEENANQDLFVLKSPDQVTDIAVINAIEVYGYGSQYQSWITNISLMAR